MTEAQELKKTILAEAQGAMRLQLAFVGVVRGLFEALARGAATAEDLAAERRVDVGYVRRWCQAAYAFGLLEVATDGPHARFTVTELGAAFAPGHAGTLMPFAVQTILGAHMADRTAELMTSGERPGESVLAERANVLPWFGPMLEASFGPLFDRDIAGLDVFRRAGERGAVVVDLGCGNGWYLRKLALRYPKLTGLGLDGFAENVTQARALAERDGLSERLDFREGDIHQLALDRRVGVIALNRALHHVWEERGDIFRKLRDALAPEGAIVVWEPRWPDDWKTLRDPGRRAMAFQNLSEHVQGNHFLCPAEIEEAMREAGLVAETSLFVDGNEAVVVGTRPA
jgi:SAM-dependent methyltransferase